MAIASAEVSAPSPEPVVRPSRRGDVIALLACVAIGLVMATLPYFLWWRVVGDFVYVADGDDMTLYVPIASQAYFEHPGYLGNPTQASGGTAIYPYLQFGPGLLLARALNWGPLGVNLGWRIWAGLTIPLGWYFVVRQFVRRPLVAGSIVVFLMTDIGLVLGSPIFREAKVVLSILRGTADSLFNAYPMLHSEWRIATPGLSLGFLLLYLGFLFRAERKQTWPSIVSAGMALGLLFHAYFYFWTAAGLGLAMTFVLDPPRRKATFFTGLIGGLIGIPAVLNGMKLKNASDPDFGPRLDTFLKIPRLSEFLIPTVALTLIVITAVWVWMRRSDLKSLWCVAAAGILLQNEQVISGMQIQNFHWAYASGPTLTLLLVLLVHGELIKVRTWPDRAAWLVAFLAALYLGVGLWLRGVESMRTKETRDNLAGYELYRERIRRPDAAKLVPHSSVAGSPDFVNYAIVLDHQLPLSHNVWTHSAVTSNEEWDNRIALNAVLNGEDREAFSRDQIAALSSGWGPWTRDPAERERRVNHRMKSFDDYRADPDAAIGKFKVRYFAGPPGHTPPGTGWLRIESGPHWDVWEFRPSGTKTP